MGYIKNLGWSTAKQRIITGLRCHVQNSSPALVTEGTQEGPCNSEVCLRWSAFEGYLWGRDLCDSYFTAQACSQNHDSAPNTTDSRSFSRALQRWAKNPHSNQQIPGQKSPLPTRKYRKLRTNTTWQMKKMKPFRKAWLWSNIKFTCQLLPFCVTDGCISVIASPDFWGTRLTSPALSSHLARKTPLIGLIGRCACHPVAPVDIPCALNTKKSWKVCF